MAVLAVKGGGGEGQNERQVVQWVLPKIDPIIEKFEVPQMLKQSNKMYDLAAGPLESLRARDRTVIKK